MRRLRLGGLGRSALRGARSVGSNGKHQTPAQLPVFQRGAELFVQNLIILSSGGIYGGDVEEHEGNRNTTPFFVPYAQLPASAEFYRPAPPGRAGRHAAPGIFTTSIGF